MCIFHASRLHVNKKNINFALAIRGVAQSG